MGHSSFCRRGDNSLVASVTRPFLVLQGLHATSVHDTILKVHMIRSKYLTKYPLFVAFSIVNHAAHMQQYRQHQTHDTVLYHGDTYMDRCGSD